VLDSDYEMDFFVSHADVDVQWAEWIASELERSGYRVIVKAWDFRPGENSIAKHDEALAICRHTLCVLSAAYVKSEVVARTAAYHQTLEGKERGLIPVKVSAGPVPPLLGPVIPIDLADVDEEEEARRRLLAGVAGQVPRVARGKFPKSRTKQVRFPGAPQEVLELRGHRPDRYFIGRDDELAILYRALRTGSPTAVIQVITGLGGLGKTRLAVEYAFRHGAGYDTVWWIRAEDPATMRGDYVELAKALELPSESDDQAIAALRQELRRRRDWLLIFDNAEEPTDIIPLLPERHTGHVLITSRRREWPHAETCHIGVLSTQAAAEYLKRRSRVADADTGLNLAEALGGLPLALVQAGSVIADGMPAIDYLDLLHKQSPQLFAEGHAADHELTIDSTWRVSVDRLARRSPAALALFRLAAFLGADAIPLARLKATALMAIELTETLTNPFQLNKATRALGEYSLAETVDGLLSIHRMVQAVTRAELGDDAPHWASVALTAIEAGFPPDVEDPSTWKDCESLLAHALACAGHATRLHIDPTMTVQLLNRVARYLLARGRLDAATAVLAQALGTAEKLNHDDPVYLSYRNVHGRLLLARGDLSALTVLEEVHRSRTQILGPEDADTLRAGRDLVEALFTQGHRAQAARLQTQLVEAFTAILGPDDLETITSLAYQATLLRDAGHYARARAIEEHVLEVRSRVLSEDHPDTLRAKANLAATLYALGELRHARTIEEEVLEAHIRVLGEEHPDTLKAKDNLAASVYALGEVGHAALSKNRWWRLISGCWARNTPTPLGQRTTSQQRYSRLVR
jgi:tetratricopeptide (TPR) repeat protein